MSIVFFLRVPQTKAEISGAGVASRSHLGLDRLLGESDRVGERRFRGHVRIDLRRLRRLFGVERDARPVKLDCESRGIAFGRTGEGGDGRRARRDAAEDPAGGQWEWEGPPDSGDKGVGLRNFGRHDWHIQAGLRGSGKRGRSRGVFWNRKGVGRGRYEARCWSARFRFGDGEGATRFQQKVSVYFMH